MKNLKKSLFCPKKSQKVTWEPDAVRLQHKIQHVSQVEAAGWDPNAVRLQHKIQHVSHGRGSRVGPRCGTFSKLVSRCCKSFQKAWSRPSTLLDNGCGAIYF